MWYGNCDALFESTLRNADRYHVFPNTEEGRRAVNKISEICRNNYIVLDGDKFYVALSGIARDYLLEHLEQKLERKEEKLRKLKVEVEELRQCVEILG